jgi:hypothetical protein
MYKMGYKWVSGVGNKLKNLGGTQKSKIYDLRVRMFQKVENP